jgi:hypothetical protein
LDPAVRLLSVAQNKRIELVDGLPKWSHLDPVFVARELLRRREPMSISDFVSALGFRSRSTASGSPGKQYHRLRVAFHLAHERGLIEPYMGGRKWVAAGLVAEEATS